MFIKKVKEFKYIEYTKLNLCKLSVHIEFSFVSGVNEMRSSEI